MCNYQDSNYGIYRFADWRVQLATWALASPKSRPPVCGRCSDLSAALDSYHIKQSIVPIPPGRVTLCSGIQCRSRGSQQQQTSQMCRQSQMCMANIPKSRFHYCWCWMLDMALADGGGFRSAVAHRVPAGLAPPPPYPCTASRPAVSSSTSRTSTWCYTRAIPPARVLHRHSRPVDLSHAVGLGFRV